MLRQWLDRRAQGNLPPDTLVPTFRIWRTAPGRWDWRCTHCWPAVSGERYGENAWGIIVSVTMPKHFEKRHPHHAALAMRRPSYSPRARTTRVA